MLRYLTAGESHGKALLAILDGIPRGLYLDIDAINHELKIRQTTYGRGARSRIESDEIEFLSGVRGGFTTGNPISFIIKNKDFWESSLDSIVGDFESKKVHRPRPGHADYAGAIKYGTNDARDVLERASARDTATRCAIGVICSEMLKKVGINLYASVLQIGKIWTNLDISRMKTKPHIADMYGVYDIAMADKFKAEIDYVKSIKDTVGGTIAVVATGMPVGIGSYTNFDQKLDAKIAHNLASLQTVKSVEFGAGVSSSSMYGSEFQDQIYYDENGEIQHSSNNAGGITGGMTNGQDIIVKCTLKPIPTVLKGLNTIDLSTHTNEQNIYERSDICHVPAACIVAKNILAYTLAEAVLSHTGAVTMEQLIERMQNAKCKMQN